jgi:hypothetical protein
MSLAFVKLYAFYAPYSDDGDDILAEVGQYQILCTFFGALIVQGELVRSSFVGPLGILLVIVNISVVFVPLWLYYKEYKETKEKEREKAEKEKEEEEEELAKKEEEGEKGSKGDEDGETTSILKREKENRNKADDEAHAQAPPLRAVNTKRSNDDDEIKPFRHIELTAGVAKTSPMMMPSQKMVLKPLPSISSSNKIFPSPRFDDHRDEKEKDGYDDFKPPPQGMSPRIKD